MAAGPGGASKRGGLAGNVELRDASQRSSLARENEASQVSGQRVRAEPGRREMWRLGLCVFYFLRFLGSRLNGQSKGNQNLAQHCLKWL